ncbi:Glycosidase [Acetitomaculum ruminis DSM 5522]|uniref:Glycosidase n=1 Tax=Acetitomaculum ruminis DSM 5522 TaxID=1120918 RepID=A0A1I1A0Q0_9FIRM|nr:alpha-amylase family glycosyl hydrolase [Acetitomaculum ruminis]SFB30138.1 Glycosidase [Acetitomaculum ruminis DSM 5522]
MTWYDETSFYHIYPLGLADAPVENDYSNVSHRLNNIIPWIDHIKALGCNGLYLGPLFESGSHGYDTTDYMKLDSRLGDNNDLKNFVLKCHEASIKVVLDGVFNHTGRDFFAFKDIQKNRENSRYKDWYLNVNFYNNNSYNDGFSYDNWGGVDLLVKLNPYNEEVRNYIADVIKFWVKEFDIDGIRLDAADVMDFEYLKHIRRVINDVKPDFWLMGEVIHGEYNRWVNNDMLIAVTNYPLHKALYSGHNEHNYFEIAHTIKRLNDMSGNNILSLRLYNFSDNHDVDRIYTKLNNKEHFVPVHILLYTLPGVPSIYYGSEFCLDAKKVYGTDVNLRPALNLEDYKDYINNNKYTNLLAKLGHLRQEIKALSYGVYQELLLTNRQYSFSRSMDNELAIITVNNDENPAGFNLPAFGKNEFVGKLSNKHLTAQNDRLDINIPPCDGEIWIPV